jgi:hypothetical protein
MFGRLLRRLWMRHESRGVPPAHVTIALAFVLPGAAITIPGVKEAIIGGLNKAFALGLSLDAPWYIGPPMMLIGVGVFIFGEYRKERARAATSAGRLSRCAINPSSRWPDGWPARTSLPGCAVGQ